MQSPIDISEAFPTDRNNYHLSDGGRPLWSIVRESLMSMLQIRRGVTETSWDQFQKGSHWPLARKVLKASIGFTVSSFHQAPGNFNRS